MKAHIKEKLYRILLEVESVSGVSIDKMKSKDRYKNFVIARNAYMYVSRETTTASLSDIGEIINRDHSTVLYAHSKTLSDPFGLAREVADEVMANLKEESGLDLLNLLNVSISLCGIARYHAERGYDFRMGFNEL